MKRIIYRSLSTFILTIICLGISAQSMYTPYDYFPGLIRAYKPAFDQNYPDWGKMLYEYPVNFEDVTDKYESYIQEYGNIKDPLTRYFKLWSRAVGPYALPDGNILLPDLPAYYKNLNEARMDARNTANARDEANWSFLGPKETFWLNESGSVNDPLSCPWQVNVYSFDVAASDNNILYCGTETGYVNKTSDAGVQWQLLSPEYPFGGGVTAVAIHPGNSDIVYVSAGNQVHRSLDGGLNWLPLLQSGEQFYANRLKIDDDNPQKIFSSSSNGVHLSTDGGNTWT
ncbi:MAG: hypothetical protein DRI83_02325 [Bacteroidetes bacterium]|nr:MAG: hypothetical protein DRI83_02325 [Bacteroidota bacterium]